jgi:hypothetical protein
MNGDDDRQPVSPAERLRQTQFELALANLRILNLEEAMRLLADHLVREGGFDKALGEAMKAALR